MAIFYCKLFFLFFVEFDYRDLRGSQTGQTQTVDAAAGGQDNKEGFHLR